MTLKSDMLRALEDDANDNLKDVTLVGSDGGRVSANKAVLAIRSPVFQRMFFGNFQERDSDEVKMDNYPSIVLQVVVKYCYVDELDLDLIYSDDHNNNKTNTTANTNQEDEQDEQEEEEVDRLTDAEAVALVQVRDAANYLELFELHKTISNELGESILSTDVGLENQRKDLACVCAVLQELMARGGSDGSLFLTLLDLVETHPEPCLLPKFSTTHNQGILACSLALLERLLQSPSVNAFVAVKALQKWNKEHNQNSSEDDDDEELTQLQTIANGVQLEQLSAPQLAEIPPCSLFSMERLYKAFVSLSKSHGPSPKPSPPFVARSATAFTFGNSSSPSSSCNQNSPDRTAKTATIRGAGVECVNGVYHLVGLSSSYQRRGTYGDLAGCFLLERAGVSGAWKIVFESETTEQTNKFFNKFCLYESTSISNNKPGIPPFALWRCLDGKDPTPYVSVQVKMADPFAAAHCYSMGGGAATNTTSDNNPLPDAPSSAQVQMAEAFRAQLAVANQNSNNNNNVDGDYNRQVRRRNVRGRRQRDN